MKKITALLIGFLGSNLGALGPGHLAELFEWVHEITFQYQYSMLPGSARLSAAYFKGVTLSDEEKLQALKDTYGENQYHAVLDLAFTKFSSIIIEPSISDTHIDLNPTPKVAPHFLALEVATKFAQEFQLEPQTSAIRETAELLCEEDILETDNPYDLEFPEILTFEAILTEFANRLRIAVEEINNEADRTLSVEKIGNQNQEANDVSDVVIANEPELSERSLH